MVSYWSLDDNLTPVIGKSLTNEIIEESKEPTLILLKNYVASIDENLTEISGAINTLSTRLLEDTTASLISDDESTAYIVQNELSGNFYEALVEISGLIGFDGTEINDIGTYLVKIETARTRLTNIIKTGTFATFIKTFPDLYMTTTEIRSGESYSDPVGHYLESNIQPQLDQLKVLSNDISFKVISALDDSQSADSLETALTLTKTYPWVSFDKLSAPTGIFAPNGKFTALHLDNNQLGKTEAVYLPNTDYSNKIAPENGTTTFVFWTNLSIEEISHDETNLLSLSFRRR